MRASCIVSYLFGLCLIVLSLIGFAAKSEFDVQQIKIKAEKGEAEAQYQLAEIFYDNNIDGVEEDDTKAAYWYYQSAQQGHTMALYSLGWLYDKGEGVIEDDTVACKYYEQSAKQGYVLAQYYLADCYHYGKGKERDYQKSLNWYKKSADQGDDDAMYQVGHFYEKGHGFKLDNVEALKWYTKAAKKGSADAIFALGRFYQYGKGTDKNMEKSCHWYLKSANLGNATAQNKVGVCYQEGDGVKQDYREALFFFRQSAAQNNKYALYNLGEAYKNGLKGILPKDEEKALQYYLDAFEAGHRAVADDIADWYYNKATPVDLKTSLRWFEKSANQGSAYGQYSLGYMYANGEGTEVDYKQAVIWYRKAAEQDHEDALFYLARLLTSGKGGERNVDEAFHFYKKAADKGNVPAQLGLAEAYLKGRGTDQDFNKAFKWYQKIIADNDTDNVEIVRSARHRFARFHLYGLDSIVTKDEKKGIAMLEGLAKEGHQWSINTLAEVADMKAKQQQRRDSNKSKAVVIIVVYLLLVMPISIWVAGRIANLETASFGKGVAYYLVQLFVIPIGADLFPSLVFYALAYFGLALIASKLIYKTAFRKIVLFTLLSQLIPLMILILAIYFILDFKLEYLQLMDWS